MSIFASILRSVYKLSGAKKAFALPEDALRREIEKQNRHRGVFTPTDRKAYYETIAVNGFPCLIAREHPKPSERAILYFFGGGMVIRMLATRAMPVDKAIIDAGTAPYRYPKWICKLICVRDFLMMKLCIVSIKFMEMMFPPERFTMPGHDAGKEYRELQAYLKTYSDKTIWNIFWSANNYEVPKTAPEMDTKIQFWVGTDEWGSRYRDLDWTKKYLPQLEVVKIPRMMHGEFVLIHPQEFVDQALGFLDER